MEPRKIKHKCIIIQKSPRSANPSFYCFEIKFFEIPNSSFKNLLLKKILKFPDLFKKQKKKISGMMKVSGKKYLLNPPLDGGTTAVYILFYSFYSKKDSTSKTLILKPHLDWMIWLRRIFFEDKKQSTQQKMQSISLKPKQSVNLLLENVSSLVSWSYFSFM